MSAYIGNNGSTTFADELYNQFLLCPLCSQIYRQPKILTCQHSFCVDCIEAHYEMDENERPYRFLMSYNRDISCPVCRTRTPLPTGGVRRLPDNFLVANLVDVVNRRKPQSLSICNGSGQPSCDICSRTTTVNESRPAVLKCLDCAKVLCKECSELHRKTKVTATHGLFSIGVEHDVECKTHRSETLRFYCEPCETCICVLCTFQDHKDHNVTSLLDGLQRHRGSFESLLDNCRNRIETLRSQLQLIDSCETGLRLAEDHIRDAAIESIAAVRRREKQLLEDMRRAIGEKTFAFMADRKSLEEQLVGLESAFTLTETMMRGTSVELLMLKKEMLGKLNAVLEADVRATPEGLRRTAQLLPDDCFADVGKSALFALGGISSEASEYHLVDGGNNDTIDVELQTENVGTRTVSTGTRDDKMNIWKAACTQTTREDSEKLPIIYPIITEPISDNVILHPIKDSRKELHLDMMTPLPSAQELSGNRREQRRSSVQGRWPLEKSNSFSSSEVPSSPITANPKNIPNFSRPKPPAPVLVDRGTEMEQITRMDESTCTPKLITCEKETSTAYVILVHKNVSTENQTMVDKGTCTFNDVTANYRNLTTTRRSVTVSRGTSTINHMMSDRASSPIRPTNTAISVLSSAISKVPLSSPAPRPVLVTSSAAGQISIRTTDRSLTTPSADGPQSTTNIISLPVKEQAPSSVASATPNAVISQHVQQQQHLPQKPSHQPTSAASWLNSTCHQT